MGGAAPVETGKKGKKSLDNEMNLVPFIDLLSCLISFLLMTAVWTQVSVLQVAQTGGLSDSNPEPDEKTISLRVTMTDRGYIFLAAGISSEIGKTAVDGRMVYDLKALEERLKIVKQSYPEQRAVTVASEDATLFEDLVSTVDLLVKNQLVDVSVTAAVN